MASKLNPKAKPYELCTNYEFKDILKQMVSQNGAFKRAMTANPVGRMLRVLMLDENYYSLTESATPAHEDVVEFLARNGITRKELDRYAFGYRGLQGPSTAAAALILFKCVDPNTCVPEENAANALALELYRAVWNIQRAVWAATKYNLPLLAEQFRKDGIAKNKARVRALGLPECLGAKLMEELEKPIEHDWYYDLRDSWGYNSDGESEHPWSEWSCPDSSDDEE